MSELRTVNKLPRSCYRCGSHRHYGVDCTFAGANNRAKTPGSTFSTENAYRYLDDATEALSIAPANTTPSQMPRKSSRKKDHPEKAESEDEPANFIRPKIARNEARSRYINFRPPPFGPQGVSADESSSRPAYRSDQYDSGSLRQERGSYYRPDPPQAEPAYVRGPGTSQIPTRPSRREIGRAPSAYSPPASMDTYSGGGYGQGQERKNDTYRPMPSAARSAWKKHRI